MSGVLVVAESRQGELREISLELIGAALALKDQAGGRVAVAVIGARRRRARRGARSAGCRRAADGRGGAASTSRPMSMAARSRR